MANLTRGGFWPEHNQGATATQTKRVRVVSNNGTAIFLGDCVTRTAAGVWGLATAGAGVSGVSQGASYYDPGQLVRKESTFLPANTTYSSTAFDTYGETDQSFIYVVADPLNVRYVAERNAGAASLADLTLNANFIANAGSTTTGLSGHKINDVGLANTAGLDFAIMDFKHNVLNDMTLAAGDYVVQINVTKVPPASAGAVGVP
jgi:hypothetical protein